MKTHLRFVNSYSRSETLMVFLPGAFLQAEDFDREGFVSVLHEREFDADALLVDADVSYYYDQTFVERLDNDVLQPYRALGYRKIWLVGISIGGFGSLIHELQLPGRIDGLVVLAPYLGRRPLGAEIAKAGGLRAWQPPSGPSPDGEVDRELWPFLRRYAAPELAAAMPPLFLGYGLADRFAANHALLAEVLPQGHVFTTEGGHDWPQWSRLWRDMLDSLPLPALSPSRRVTRGLRPAPTETIAA